MALTILGQADDTGVMSASAEPTLGKLKLTPRFSGELSDALISATGSATLARILQARHITTPDDMDTAVARLLPAADLLGVDDAVAIIDKAIDEHKKILIIGDFDCDGATSTALMMRVLTQMGARVDFLVPDRFKFGYGLTPEIVEHGAQHFSPEVIITVDNGISSHEGVARAHALGIQVVITDHHLTTKSAPPADAVVNPNQLGCPFGSKWLVGVGVAFYVMGRLAKKRREMGKSSANVAQHLDLVALGTIADLGVLDHNNRILVTHGLSAIREGRACHGILAIIAQAGVDYQTLSSTDFGFTIAPRINAAGRMDDMRIGVACLLADDYQTAYALAGQLNQLNQSRRSVEAQMKAEAVAIIEQIGIDGADASNKDSTDKKSVVLYQDNWHQGVIGIVAGRIKEALHRPSIIFAPADSDKLDGDDLIKGSARSIPGIHIRDAIEAVAVTHPKLIEHFGGHAMAAGLTIRKQHFSAFVDAFEMQMASYDETVFQAEQFTDGKLAPADFSIAFVNALNHLSVWGNGFMAPSFDGEFSVLEYRILKEKHLKLILRHEGVQYPIEAICFNFDAKKWDYRASRVHLLYQLDINEWQGEQRLQLIIRDLSVLELLSF